MTVAIIKEARQKLGITQQKLALLLGMTRPALAKIEGGVEGRKETKGHIAHIVAIELIHEHGLLDKLATKLKEENVLNHRLAVGLPVTLSE